MDNLEFLVSELRRIAFEKDMSFENTKNTNIYTPSKLKKSFIEYSQRKQPIFIILDAFELFAHRYKQVNTH